MTFAVRQSPGASPVASDIRKIIRSSGAISSACSLSILGPRLSSPGDLFGLRSFSSLVIPFSVMSMSSKTGTDARQLAFRSSGRSLLLIHPCYRKMLIETVY